MVLESTQESSDFGYLFLHFSREATGVESKNCESCTQGENVNGHFHRLDRMPTKRGRFGKHDVIGILYEDPNGESLWRITLTPGLDGVYFVQSGKFYSGQIDIITPTREEQIAVGGELAHVNQNEKNAILNAIKEWESSDS
jgi:hypothetical protein